MVSSRIWSLEFFFSRASRVDYTFLRRYEMMRTRSPKSEMLDSRLIFLDLETTGASADRDRITEIGLIEVAGAKLLQEWSTLVDPGRLIPPAVVSLTGITDRMVAEAPTFADIAAELLERLEGRLLVAHNARFDYAFLRAEFRRLGIRYRSRVLCTVRLSRALFPEHRHHNLDSVIDRFALSCSARHRALGDAQAVWAFARELERSVEPHRLAQAVAAATQVPWLPPGLDHERFDDLPEAPGVYAFYASDGAPLYVGSALNLRSRVLAHFTGGGKLDRAQALALQTASLEWTETAGGLGAALREIALLRALTPLYNRRHATSPGWSLRWKPGGQVDPVPLDSEQDIESDSLYGVFRNRGDAWAALRGVARSQALCAILLGLEAGRGPCSAYAGGACGGACVGRETAAQHMMRLASALARLRFNPWPFGGRVAVREADADRGMSEIHVLDQWRHLGSARTDDELAALLEQRDIPLFDVDQYRLLKRHLADSRRASVVIDLARPAASVSV
jgi:DNA polymerase-3 subunit epsilon